jgi:uncharacterized Rmd1/YagE family protein
MYSVTALHIKNSLNIKQCRLKLDLSVIYSDSDELFMLLREKQFVYVFQYGVIAFFNCSHSDINSIIKVLNPELKSWQEQDLKETIKVEVSGQLTQVNFDKVILHEFNIEAIRLVMLNTSQSVALDKYLDITDLLLNETTIYTKELEDKGRLRISGRKLKRFIGRVLNIKNQISENLYIFDSPDITWENQELNRLDNLLKQTFDLKDRYRYLSERTAIIKEDLELFKDIMDHKESSKLEWIIIALILVEVIDLFVIRLLKMF